MQRPRRFPAPSALARADAEIPDEVKIATLFPSSCCQPRAIAGQLFLVAGLFAPVLALQASNRAYTSDLGAHADEAAHLVTGLMIRDYLAGPLWRLESPAAFAKATYERFPKIALGHYPPVFYLVEGVWLLPFRTRTMALMLCALITAIAAALVIRLALPLTGPPGAVAAGLAFCWIQPVQTYSAIIMSDLMLVAWCLAALLAWRRFDQTRQGKDALFFGACATAAILTKGSGMALALVPPLAMLLTGSLRILKLRALWLAPLPVLLLALPWMAATSHITREGMTGQTPAAFFQEALPFYLRAFPETFGWVATAGILGAFVLLIIRWTRGQGPNPTQALLWSLLTASLLLASLIPAGLDGRYLLPVLPSVLILGLDALSSLIPPGTSLSSAPAAPLAWARAAAIAVLLVLGKHDAPDKWISGPTALVQKIAATSAGRREPLRLLVSSDASGEGSLIAAAALRSPYGLTVLRGTKILSTSDWMGRSYQAHFDSRETLVRLLAEQRVDYLIIDDGVAPAAWTPHHRLLQTIFATGCPEGFDPAFTVPAERRQLKTTLRAFRLRK